jgi:sRNA-binding protein
MNDEEKFWRKRWPLAFSSARQPLKIGIHRDMGIGDYNDTMREWVTNRKYLKNLLVPNVVRIDLEGRPTGNVTDAERKYAAEQLNMYRRYTYEPDDDIWRIY